MNKIIILLICIICLLGFHPIKAQDTSLFKFFPLKINNLWVYYGSGANPMGHTTWYDKYKVVTTTQINSKTYFVIEHTRVIINIVGNIEIQPIRIFKGDIPLRIDSVNFNIYKSTNCGVYPELLVDSLKARQNDTSSTCDFHGGRVTCVDTSIIDIFNANRQSKQFLIQAFEGGNFQTYVKGIGVSYFNWSQLMTSMIYDLRGCIINGTLYGDTSMIVGIQNGSKNIPEQFSLSQNYPNPFNPVTIINYQLPISGQVKLVIYDVLGREIAVLVNAKQTPGTYQVEWDGTKYPSGVYFYKLISADYIETKKMVLIK